MALTAGNKKICIDIAWEYVKKWQQSYKTFWTPLVYGLSKTRVTFKVIYLGYCKPSLFAKLSYKISTDLQRCSVTPSVLAERLVWHMVKGSLYSITERRVPDLIPALGSQPAGDVSRKPGGRLPLLSARPVITSATLKRAATSFAAWWQEAGWVWTVCLSLLWQPDSVAAAIWTKALLRLSPAR